MNRRHETLVDLLEVSSHRGIAEHQDDRTDSEEDLRHLRSHFLSVKLIRGYSEFREEERVCMLGCLDDEHCEDTDRNLNDWFFQNRPYASFRTYSEPHCRNVDKHKSSIEVGNFTDLRNCPKSEKVKLDT